MRGKRFFNYARQNMTEFFDPVDAGNTYYFFVRGDEAALGRLYNRFYRRLVRDGCRIVPDEFEVSVMVQECFLKLWNHRERIESLTHAWFFLRLVLRWKCYRWHRLQKRRIRCCPGTRLDEQVAAEPSYDPLHERQFEERLALVNRVLPYLPPKKQTEQIKMQK